MRSSPEGAPTSMISDEADDTIEQDDAVAAAETIPIGSDVCQSLMDRYARSSAPQHRHLCASAAAMRSILVEEGLPLTPPAYFAAAITAVRDSGRTDSAALAALAAFLSILLPHVAAQAIPQAKAKEAAGVIADILGDLPSGTATGTVRSMISSLGALVLRVDLDDWSAVELPLNTLLRFAVDKRPKIRRCAQACVDKVFKALQSSIHIKKASKVVYFMYKKYVPTVKEFTSIKFRDAPQSKVLSEPGVTESLHMLNILNPVLPCLSEKVKMKLLSDVYKLLGRRFSWHTRHVLSLLQLLFEHSKVRVLVPESENIISALTSYVSFGEKNPRDTVICASTMLKSFLNKLHDIQPNICLKNLPLIINSIAGRLDSDVTSKHVADILEELIKVHIDNSILQITPSQSCKDEKGNILEETVVISICTAFTNMLGNSEVPTEYLLSVIAVLFLKLGEFSSLFMKKIILKLSRWATCADKDVPKHVHVCIGAALVAMGPENFLSLIPISFHVEKLTCSNTWLIPILKKYVVGSSLQYFMEHIVPLAKSLHDACSRAKKVQTRKKLESYSFGLWSLLPTFCCYPTDTSQSFESLANLLIVLLKEEPSLHESMAIALKKLVNENRSIHECNIEEESCSDPTLSFFYNEFNIEPRSLHFYYSKKTASRNMKALAAHSLGLFEALTDIFFVSPPEKRKYMKETIGCLASMIGDENLHHFFVSSVEKFKPLDALADSGNKEGKLSVPVEKFKPLDALADSGNKEGKLSVPDKTEAADTRGKREKHEDKRCLFMELISSFVQAANVDLMNLFFGYIQSLLMESDETCHSEAYHTLSLMLKEHSWFRAARIEELMDLLLSMKSSANGVVLKNRLSCYHYLLVHMLMSDEENMEPRAFLILNEIILILKSKKESRKLAYDVLLEITGSLKNSQQVIGDTLLLRLFNMVMGYLSSPSHHIMSGAISALSLLIHNDASFCLTVPNLIPSVLVLLQNKDNEVIKASLGFIKVLVSSLSSSELLKLLSDILDGILPWLTVSKHHFRSKVGIILEILMRKCGSDTIDSFVPEKYQRFVRKVAEARQSKKIPKTDLNSEADVKSKDSNSSVQPDIGQKRVIKAEKFPKGATGNPRMKRKFEKDGSNANGASRGTVGDGSGQFSRSNNNLNSKNPLVVRQNSGDKKKIIVDDKPNGGHKMKMGRKKDSNLNNAAATSKSGVHLKFNKHKRMRNS